MTLRSPPEAVRLTKYFEGLRLVAYQCQAGVWTIGYGRTRGVRKGQTITEADADMMLLEDIAEFEAEVDRLVTADVPDVQIGALTALAFNIGLGAFAKSSILKAVNAGNPVDALWLQWSLYTDAASGKKLTSNGLARRRRAELALFHEGDDDDVVLAGAVVSVAPPADTRPLAKSWTLRGAALAIVGTLANYIEVGFSYLTDLAKWAGDASTALGPIAGLAKTASGIIPASGTALVAAGLVIVISRRVQGK
jgi:lysozyme